MRPCVHFSRYSVPFENRLKRVVKVNRFVSSFHLMCQMVHHNRSCPCSSMSSRSSSWPYLSGPLDCQISGAQRSGEVFPSIQERTILSTGSLSCSCNMVGTSRSTTSATSSSLVIKSCVFKWGAAAVDSVFFARRVSGSLITMSWAAGALHCR